MLDAFLIGDRYSWPSKPHYQQPLPSLFLGINGPNHLDDKDNVLHGKQIRTHPVFHSHQWLVKISKQPHLRELMFLLID